MSMLSTVQRYHIFTKFVMTDTDTLEKNVLGANIDMEPFRVIIGYCFYSNTVYTFFTW